MILSEKDVQNIIPQKHPFVLVGELLSIDEKTTRTNFKIPKNHILLINNELPSSALIENMAQTAAVRAGYFAKAQNSKPKTGFIGSIKNFEVYRTAKSGEILTTTITNTNEIFNASIVEGKIFCQEQLVAKGELKIFLIDEEINA